MSTRPSTPSLLLASSRPLLARALNERSLRPPMSVTRPTLIFLPVEADDVEDDDELLLDLSLELPHAATPNAVTDMVRAMVIALRERRCTDPPSGGPRGVGLPGAQPRGPIYRRAPSSSVRPARSSSRSAGSAKLARTPSAVIARSSSSLRPKRSLATAYSPPIDAPKYGGSSEASVTRTPAARRAGSGWLA